VKDLESHLGEDGQDFAHHLRRRMQAPATRLPPGQRHVQCFRRQPTGDHLFAQRALLPIVSLLQRLLEPVDRLPIGRALRRGQRADLFEG